MTVIVLNGIGSVGKSSTAKALQEITEQLFYHVAGDAFLGMMPPRLWNHHDGIVIEQVAGENGAPSLSIAMGKEIDRLMDGMRLAVAAMAGTGANLIIDDVMLSSDAQRAYQTYLPDADLHFVGLHAPLTVLELREASRGDRMRGLARWQWGRVHSGITYDVEVDTTSGSPTEIALVICAGLGLATR